MMQKIPTFIPVVAAALIRADGHVLMQRRKLRKAHGGLWEFPGGKLENDETPEAAVIREIAEELGVVVESGNILPLSFASSCAETASKPVLLLLYTTRLWQGAPAALEPGTHVRWVSAQELLALPMPPLDIPLAQALIPMLEGVAKGKRPT